MEKFFFPFPFQDSGIALPFGFSNMHIYKYIDIKGKYRALFRTLNSFRSGRNKVHPGHHVLCLRRRRKHKTHTLTWPYECMNILDIGCNTNSVRMCLGNTRVLMNIRFQFVGCVKRQVYIKLNPTKI